MQANSVRFLALLYSLFFLTLTGLVLWEALETKAWTNVPSSHSVLVGVASLSGWFAKVLGLTNLVFGFGGGLFTDQSELETWWSRATRLGLYWLVALLVVATLVALWVVANHVARIDEKVADLAAAHLKPSDALTTIGVLNLGIAGGFLLGLAVPGAPGVSQEAQP